MSTEGDRLPTPSFALASSLDYSLPERQGPAQSYTLSPFERVRQGGEEPLKRVLAWLLSLAEKRLRLPPPAHHLITHCTKPGNGYPVCRRDAGYPLLLECNGWILASHTPPHQNVGALRSIHA